MIFQIQIYNFFPYVFFLGGGGSFLSTYVICIYIFWEGGGFPMIAVKILPKDFFRGRGRGGGMGNQRILSEDFF